MSKYTDDDYCDIYEKKICDNCGKCLEEQGIDIRAINIEDIAKTVDENKFLEDEYKKSLGEIVEEDEKEEISYDNLSLKEAYEVFGKESGLKLDVLNEEYEDAFDHIEILEDEFFQEGSLEELTEEVFPGVRRLKKKN